MAVSARCAPILLRDHDALLRRWALPALGLAWLGTQWLLDAPLARLAFDWEGGQWALRQHVLLEGILHRGGRTLSLLAWLLLSVAAVVHWRHPSAKEWTRPAARLLLAVLASTLVVAWLKSATHVDCPWDLRGYGGDRPFVALFATRPADLGQPACFPAAHAASGYAWVALYFFFATVRPQWRWVGLGIGLLAGLVFGVAQQLRGAHFLSHDIASLAVCWAMASTLAAPGQRGRLATGSAT